MVDEGGGRRMHLVSYVRGDGGEDSLFDGMDVLEVGDGSC